MSSLPSWMPWKSRSLASTSAAATSCMRTSKCAPQLRVTPYYVPVAHAPAGRSNAFCMALRLQTELERSLQRGVLSTSCSPHVSLKQNFLQFGPSSRCCGLSVATVCRNRTTTYAEHYINAFAEEKRRQARRGSPVSFSHSACLLIDDLVVM